MTVFILSVEQVYDGFLETAHHVFSTYDKALQRLTPMLKSAKSDILNDGYNWEIDNDEPGNFQAHVIGEASQNAYSIYITEHTVDADDNDEAEDCEREIVTTWLRRNGGHIDLEEKYHRPIGYYRYADLTLDENGHPQTLALDIVRLPDGTEVTPEDDLWDEIDHDDCVNVAWDDMSTFERQNFADLARQDNGI